MLTKCTIRSRTTKACLKERLARRFSRHVFAVGSLIVFHFSWRCFRRRHDLHVRVQSTIAYNAKNTERHKSIILEDVASNGRRHTAYQRVDGHAYSNNRAWKKYFLRFMNLLWEQLFLVTSVPQLKNAARRFFNIITVIPTLGNCSNPVFSQFVSFRTRANGW